MSEEVTVRCIHCHKLIEPLSDGVFYQNPKTGKLLVFHPSKCHDEAWKDSRKYGIDDFKLLYGSGEHELLK